MRGRGGKGRGAALFCLPLDVFFDVPRRGRRCRPLAAPRPLRLPHACRREARGRGARRSLRHDVLDACLHRRHKEGQHQRPPRPRRRRLHPPVLQRRGSAAPPRPCDGRAAVRAWAGGWTHAGTHHRQHASGDRTRIRRVRRGLQGGVLCAGRARAGQAGQVRGAVRGGTRTDAPRRGKRRCSRTLDGRSGGSAARGGGAAHTHARRAGGSVGGAACAGRREHARSGVRASPGASAAAGRTQRAG